MIEIVPSVSSGVAMQRVEALSVTVGEAVTCRQRYAGHVLGIEIGPVIDGLHFLSAGMVGFARGLNDTPKMAALLLILPGIGSIGSLSLIGVIIAIGGIASARKVAEVMSQKITPMNHGQGLTANLMTTSIVIVATQMGWPVSTTHVSCGTLFGIGTVTGQARWLTIAKILLAWITTLPVAIGLSVIAYWSLKLA